MFYRTLWQSVFSKDGSVNIYILLAGVLILCQEVQTIFPPSWMWVGPLTALTNRPQECTVQVLSVSGLATSTCCLLEGLLWWKPVTMKNHKWYLKYLLLVRSQAMSLCFTNSLKTLLQPPCLRLAIEATKLQGTISWFFMPISTWN